MSKAEYKQARREHRKLSKLLKFAYTIADRDIRVQAVATLQTKLGEIAA